MKVNIIVNGHLKEVDDSTLDIPEVQPQLVPETITRSQFFKQVWYMGVINTDQCLKAIAKLELPPQIMAAIDAITDQHTKDATLIEAMSADVFHRHSDLVEQVRLANPTWTPEQVDQIWIEGATR